MNINLNCRLNSTSLGLVGLNLLKSLVETGNSVTYWPIEDIDRVQADLEYHELIKNALSKQGLYSKQASCVRHNHPNDLASYVGVGAKIGSTVFELDKLTDVELNHLSMPDGLVVPSSWGKQILIENGLKQPIGVVPHGVDRAIFNETLPSALKFDRNPTVFLNVSKIELRKGHIELLDAFNKAFNKNDNVILIMCWRNRFYSKEENEKWDKMYKESSLGDKIYILPEFLTNQQEVAKLYRSCDCNLSIAKAEGFGLSGLEAMSCGRHVIATNYSGQTEYCNHDNSLLISIDELETAYDGFWFKSGIGRWATFGDNQMDQLIEHMRFIHKKKQDGTLGINQAGLETAKQFSWDAATNKLTNFITEIGG